MPTKKPKFYTKKGWLTPYALNCGYIEKQTKNTEGAPFHGTQIILEGVMADKLFYVVTVWNGYLHTTEIHDTIRAARRAFKRSCKLQGVELRLPVHAYLTDS